VGASWDWWWIVLLNVGAVLGMIISAVTIYGAVRMQTLESRIWGMVSGVLVMVPTTAVAPLGVISIGLTALFGLLFGDEALPWLMPVWSLIVYGLYIAIGVWTIMTLIRQDVIDGYEYIPE
jgi:hypothetical protein